MEQLQIFFKNADKFDTVLEENRKANLPECGDLTIITKDNATAKGKPGVMFAFSVMVNGERKRVQAVTTLRNMILWASMLKDQHPEMFPDLPPQS